MSIEAPTYDTKISAALDVLKQRLLDIGNRNRLINTPRRKSRAKAIEIIDERADVCFKILHREKRSMRFLPRPEPEHSPSKSDEVADVDFDIYVPPDDNIDAKGNAERHLDNKLQTALSAPALQKKLVTLSRDARLLEEEQGINILFLALGFLKWFESDTSEIARYAPLVLVPVQLTRDTVRGQFRLSALDQDLEENLSLRAKLKADFDIDLPDLPDSDDWLPSTYFAEVRRRLSAQPAWSVETDDMVLGFYSFAKFLMWRDLAIENWPSPEHLLNHPILKGALSTGFEERAALIDESDNLDEHFEPEDLGHVVDADASQTRVIASAAAESNLVVQGPPGTGKSQTITNIISAALQQNKKILFIAEKMVALEVVHSRLKKAGLGPMCLELHSRKANKTVVLAELQRTLNISAIKKSKPHFDELKTNRNRLNRLSSLIHQVDPKTQVSPFQIIGEQCHLRERGIPLPRFTLDEAPNWSDKEFAQYKNDVSQMASLVGQHGSPNDHIWRGTRKRLIPTDLDRLGPEIDALLITLSSHKDLLTRLCHTLSIEVIDTLQAAHDAETRLVLLASKPVSDYSAVDFARLLDNLLTLDALFNTVRETQRLTQGIEGVVHQSALSQDWPSTRLAIKAHGDRWLRIFSSDYRKARTLLKGALQCPVPKSTDAQLDLIEDVIALNAAKAKIEQEDSVARNVFGKEWLGIDTYTPRLSALTDWTKDGISALSEPSRVQGLFAITEPREETQTSLSRIKTFTNDFLVNFQKIADRIDLDLHVAFGETDLQSVPFELIESRARAWRHDPESVDDWYRLTSSMDACRKSGFSEIVDQLCHNQMDPNSATEQFRLARAETLWRDLINRVPELADIDGEQRNQWVHAFRKFDERLMVLTAEELLDNHVQQLPRGSAGAMGLLRGEMAKKRRIMPLRKLMDTTGEAIQRIKPVFLMSPISVAQYLPPGQLSFDLVLVDEASQVRPEDAIGAFARGTQVVVVGDSQQLPPTSFFDRQIDAEENDNESEDEAFASQAGDMESILKLCEARGMASSTLNWHYRSKHPSLIEVSNRNFYDRKLIYPPSPDRKTQQSGLKLNRLNGVYDRGGARDNKMEAARVVEAIIEHAREHPSLSLGVVTFSVAQRNAIEIALEKRRAADASIEPFFDTNRDEAFFVKSLENVQGDERDVIFVSVGYGRDENGQLSQGFGPVSREGGERRLNVLFTRAKQQCVIFSSISFRDIDDTKSRHRGTSVLKAFLRFAELGEMEAPRITGRDYDSPFEEAVAAAIRKAGYEVEPQIGSAGFFVDLGIMDPEHPGHFILGVECDGATYHSASWARERDRLRQAVLENKGWKLHRVWSTDWFKQPQNELRKILSAVDKARAELDEGKVFNECLESNRSDTEDISVPDTPHGQPQVERQVTTSNRRVLHPYQEASFSIDDLAAHPLHNVPTPNLAQILTRIVTMEGPIHREEIGRRLRDLWRLKRAGGRIQAATERALDWANAHGKVERADPRDSDFWIAKDAAPLSQVRDRSHVSSPSLRRVDMLPPTELDLGVAQALEANVTLDRPGCATEIARALGFKSTSSELRARIEERIDHMIANQKLYEDNGWLRAT